MFVLKPQVREEVGPFLCPTSQLNTLSKRLLNDTFSSTAAFTTRMTPVQRRSPEQIKTRYGQLHQKHLSSSKDNVFAGGQAPGRAKRVRCVRACVCVRVCPLVCECAFVRVCQFMFTPKILHKHCAMLTEIEFAQTSQIVFSTFNQSMFVSFWQC